MPDAPAEAPAVIIRGRDWYKEVGGVSYKKQEIREKFYLERAKFKLGVKDIEKMSPSEQGLFTFAALRKFPELTMEVKKGQTLAQILKDYFRNNCGLMDEKRIDREMYLTMYWLSNEGFEEKTNRKINVDLIRIGETVTISDGKLTIVSPDGQKRVKDVIIRNPTS